MTDLERTILTARFNRMTPKQRADALTVLTRFVECLLARTKEQPPAVVRARMLGVRCCETSEN